MLTTSTAINAALGTVDVDYTTQIAQWSAVIESYCGRGFGARDITDTFRLLQPRARLVLSAYPVTAVLSVVEAGAELATGDYEVSASTGIMARLSGDFLSMWSCGKTAVTFAAGYILPSDAPDAPEATLPADIQQCCVELVARAVQLQGRDPTLRSYESPDVETITFMDADKIEMKRGLPADIAARLDPYRSIRL